MMLLDGIVENWHRCLTYVILAGLGLGAGYYLGGARQRVVVTQQVDLTHTEVQWRDRIVTVTRTVQANGTVTEVTRTEDQQKQVDASTSHTETVTTPVSTSAEYSLGIRYAPSYSDLLPSLIRPDISAIELTGSRRLLGPVWVEVGAGLQRISLGIRYEF